MTLRGLLSVPYLVEAEATETCPGRWVRRVSHPELPDCRVEASGVVDALHALDRRRIEVIVGMLRRGGSPPVPRPPFEGADPDGLLARHGLHAELAPLLDMTAVDVSRS